MNNDVLGEMYSKAAGGLLAEANIAFTVVVNVKLEDTEV